LYQEREGEKSIVQEREVLVKMKSSRGIKRVKEDHQTTMVEVLCTEGGEGIGNGALVRKI